MWVYLAVATECGTEANPTEALSQSGVKMFRNDEDQITHLQFSGVENTDSNLAYLKKLNHLEILDLDNSRVTDSGMTHLAELKQLKTLLQ